MANKSSNTAVEHREKQRKKKNLSDEYIYGSQGSSVELHKLANYKVEDRKLGDILIEKDEEIGILNERLDNTKKVLISMIDRIEKIESRLRIYGLE